MLVLQISTSVPVTLVRTGPRAAMNKTSLHVHARQDFQELLALSVSTELYTPIMLSQT